jgi:hypothetical protein
MATYFAVMSITGCKILESIDDVQRIDHGSTTIRVKKEEAITQFHRWQQRMLTLDMMSRANIKLVKIMSLDEYLK